MPLKKRSITIAGHATSISLEDDFWQALEKIAISRGLSVPALVSEIDETRDDDQNLSSAVRIYTLKYFMNQGDDITL